MRDESFFNPHPTFVTIHGIRGSTMAHDGRWMALRLVAAWLLLPAACAFCAPASRRASGRALRAGTSARLSATALTTLQRLTEEFNRVRAKSPSAPLFLPLLQVFAGNIFAAWLLAVTEQSCNLANPLLLRAFLHSFSPEAAAAEPCMIDVD